MIWYYLQHIRNIYITIVKQMYIYIFLIKLNHELSKSRWEGEDRKIIFQLHQKLEHYCSFNSIDTILNRTYRALLPMLSRWWWFCRSYLGPGLQSVSSALPAFGGRNTLGLGREVYSSFFFSEEVANVTDTWVRNFWGWTQHTGQWFFTLLTPNVYNRQQC